jgi:hypothetical protein
MMQGFFIVARHARKIKSVGVGYRDHEHDDVHILSELEMSSIDWLAYHTPTSPYLAERIY